MNIKSKRHDKELLQRMTLISFILSLPIIYLIYVSYNTYSENKKFLNFEIIGAYKTEILNNELSNVVIQNSVEVTPEIKKMITPEVFQKEFEISSKDQGLLYQIESNKKFKNREELANKVYIPIIRLTANYSKLILDAHLDTYYLMDIISLRLPELLKSLLDDSGFVNIEKALLQNDRVIKDIRFSLEESKKASSNPEKFKLLEEIVVDLESEFLYQYNNNQKYSTNAFSLKAKKLNQEASKLLIEKLKEQKKKVNDYYEIVLTLTVLLWGLAFVLSVYLYFSLVRKKIIDAEKIVEQEKLLFQTEKLSSIGELAGVIVHEIKNPLTIIDYESNALVRKIDKNEVDLEKCREKLIKMSEMTTRISKLSNLLTNYTRDNYDEIFDWVEVNSILSEVIYLTNLKAKKFNIKISFSESDLKIKCNQFQVEQVFINLVNNSIDAICEKSEKWIKINVINIPAKSAVRFEVIDSGEGIDPVVVEKMFNSFYTTKKTGKGTGLGLAITNKIIGQHHGRIFYDETSTNTKIVVELPTV